MVGIVGLSDKSLYEPLVATVANVGLFNISDQLTGSLEPPPEDDITLFSSIVIPVPAVNLSCLVANSVLVTKLLSLVNCEVLVGILEVAASSASAATLSAYSFVLCLL